MTAQRKESSTTFLRRSVQILAIALAVASAGCGGGGGSSKVDAVVPGGAAPVQLAANSFTVTGDDYGVQNPTFLAATGSQDAMVLRAAIASSLSDPDFRTTVRIDIPDPQRFAAGVYSLDPAAAGATPFPGALYVFDGHASTMLQTVGGSITFTSFGSANGEPIAGSFTALVLDGNDSARSTYTISGNFTFSAGSYGAVSGTPIPAQGPATFDAQCAGCHSLGSYDRSANGAPDVALKGGKVGGLFTADTVGHQGVRLSGSQIGAIKILLNAY